MKPGQNCGEAVDYWLSSVPGFYGLAFDFMVQSIYTTMIHEKTKVNRLCILICIIAVAMK
jgi:hypothetical protein